MRIAIFDYRITRTNPVGGCHLRTIEALAKDHVFTVFAVEFDNPDAGRVEWVRIPAPKRPLALLFVAFHILAPLYYLAYRIRKRLKFDLIQMVESNLTFGTIVYSQFCHRAYLTYQWKKSRPSGIRGILRLIDHALHACLEPMIYRKAKIIVAPSLGLAAEISRTYKGVSNKLRILHNPVDIERMIAPGDFNRDAFRTSLGIEARHLMLVFVALGHFERKGLPTILAALKQLSDPVIRLCVVGGESDLIRRYRSIVRNMGLQDIVSFAGVQTDIRPYLWAADTFILPSVYETFSLVSFEAAAATLPLIVGPVYGVEDLMAEANCGFAVEPETTAVAGAIARVASMDRDARRALGMNARTAVQHYSTSRFVQAWRELYAGQMVGFERGRARGTKV